MRNLATALAATLVVAVSLQPESARSQDEATRVIPAEEPPSAAPIAIDLLEVVVTGNTVLDDRTVYQVVEPFLGRGRTVDDVDRIRQALEETYRERGYNTVSVRIPKQTSRDGVVRLDVVESRIARLSVVGSRYHSLARIKELAPSVAPGSVPDFDRVQQDLIALNGTPDLRVTPALKQGLVPDTLDMDLAVDDSLPAHGSLELNNRHGQDTAPLRSQVALSYTNLWQRGHGLTLTYQTAPQAQQQSQVFVGAYTARFDGTPLSLMLNYVKSDSRIATVGGINVVGAGEIVGLRLFLPVEGTSSLFPTVSVGLDYKSFDSLTALPDTGQGEKSFTTPVTYWPMSVALGVLSRETRSTTQADLTFSFASPQLGSETAELDDSRYRARGQQFAVRGSLGHTQELPFEFQAGIRAAAQTTDQPLISSEQFAAGGADTVRGYLESAALGDTGAIGSIELRSPALGRFLPWDAGAIYDDLRVFAFIDAAEIRVRDALPDQITAYRLRSRGYGFRFDIASTVQGIAQWAEPLIDLPGKAPEPARVLFRLTSSF